MLKMKNRTTAGFCVQGFGDSTLDQGQATTDTPREGGRHSEEHAASQTQDVTGAGRP